MKELSLSRWISISLFNLMLVAMLGAVMRYKIGFEFPFLNQKNLQHAHSHFAFSGWVSQMLMAYMVDELRKVGNRQSFKPYNLVLWGNFICAIGMLIAFSIQGYGKFSIFFATSSIFISYYFVWQYIKDLRQVPSMAHRPWFIAALSYNVLSTVGTFALVFMIITKNISQHLYLASVYWYLHFQYNGWFFFGCVGLFLQQIAPSQIVSPSMKRIFWLFAVSCVLAFGLSVLWAHLPIWSYIVVILAAIAQALAWILLLKEFYKQGFWHILSTRMLSRVLGIFLIVAISIKFSLQLGSVIPSISKLAFGFRPIVIAYLHLVLLAIITVYLITHSYLYGVLQKNRLTTIGIYTFILGILSNELALAIQGIASFSYTVLPGINQVLFFIALIMLLGITMLFLGKQIKNNPL